MRVLVKRIHHLKQVQFKANGIVNDNFWNLLLLTSVMLATLIGLPRLF